MIIHPSIRKIGPALLSTLFWGLILGVYLWNILYGYKESTYEVKLGTNFIAYPDFKVPQSYFHKKFYLNNASAIKNAWLRISAPEGFKVYLNGRHIGSTTTNGEIATEFYNITPLLETGANLISVYNNVERSERSMISAEGYYENWQGIVWKIISDETWKVSFFEPNQIDSKLEWHDLKMRDDDWENALILKPQMIEKKDKINYPPSLFTSSLKSQFVWGNFKENKIFFRYPVFIEDKASLKDVWIRTFIEPRYSYNFLVNGTLIDSMGDTVGVPEAAITSKKFNTYKITQYLHQGKNVIGIFVYNETSNPQFYMDGIIVDKNDNENLLDFSREGKYSDKFSKGWYKETFNDAMWGQPFHVGDVSTQEVSIKREIAETNPTADCILIYYLKKYSFVITVAVLILIVWFSLSYLLSKFKRLPVQTFLATIGVVNLLLFLILLFLYILSFDDRFYPAYPFQLKFIMLPTFIFLVTVIVIAFFLEEKDLESL